VVATILILALTVVLFAALFAFVSRFPAPPAQTVNQFQATALKTGTAITGLNILQEGGPAVPSTDRVYLVSTRASADWQFNQANGIPVAWGIGNTSSGWATGVYWSTTFGTSVKLPANITVYILSSTQLLYSGVVPGAPLNVPPTLTSTYTVPGTIAVGAAFQIVALVSGNTANLTVNVSLAEVPGLSTSIQTMHPMGGGEWVYNVTSGSTTTAGTYLAYVQGANTTGSTIAGSVTITITGSSSTTPTVALTITPNPPTVRTNSTLVASVVNPGTASFTVSNVTYYVNGSANKTNLETLYAPSGSLPTLAAHSSVVVSSPAWVAKPTWTGGVNLTVVVKFSSGSPAKGVQVASIGAAPYAVTLSIFAQNSTLKTNGTWNFLVTIDNYGQLGGNTVNITFYVNKTTTTTAEGKIVSPTGASIANPGYGTTTAGSALGGNQTTTWVTQYRGPGGGSTMSLTVVVIVKITNSAWSSFGTATLAIYDKTTPAFTD